MIEYASEILRTTAVALSRSKSSYRLEMLAGILLFIRAVIDCLSLGSSIANVSIRNSAIAAELPKNSRTGSPAFAKENSTAHQANAKANVVLNTHE